MTQQMSLCPEYGATCADYRVIELTGPALTRGLTLRDSRLPDWKQVQQTADYDRAADVARRHCVLSGREVWVFDSNDDGYVVFRVTPEEYTAQALGARSTGHTN